MQTVTNSVLSPSQSTSKSAKSITSQDADSSRHLFAENLQKAKQGLESDSKTLATESSSKTTQNLDAKTATSADDTSSVNGAVKLVSSDADSTSSEEVATDTKSQAELDRTSALATTPNNRLSSADLADLSDADKNTTQTASADSGNNLHTVGQNAPKEESLETSPAGSLGNLAVDAEVRSTNGATLAAQSKTEVEKNAEPSKVPSLEGVKELASDQNGVLKTPKGEDSESMADTGEIQHTIDQSNALKSDGSYPINKDTVVIDSDSQQASRLRDPQLSAVDPANGQGEEKSPKLDSTTNIMVTADTQLDDGSNETAVNNAAAVNNSADLLSSSQQPLTSAIQTENPDGVLADNKIPAEVRALLASEGKVKDVSAGLASIGLAAKGVTGNRLKVAASDGDKPLSATENLPALKVSEQAGDSDTGELSWVLSQMGNTVPATQVAGQTNITEGDGVITPAATTKVADQVALANQMKADQSLAAAPFTLAGLAVGKADANGTMEGVDLGNLAEETLFPNEPLELRKKEQDALLGKMTSQLDGVTKDTDTGGLNSSITSAANTATRVTPAPSNLQPMNAAQNLAMSVPPNHPGWAGEMSQKVAVVAQSGGHTAHIKLDPPELGSLTVKVSVDSDNNNAQVSFMAATPQARDLLESQMGRLREMLAQQGMDLGNVDVGVSQQDVSGGQYQDSGEDTGGSNRGGFLAGDEADDELPTQNISYISPSGVDYYA